MRLPVHILVMTDPKTRVVNPTACHPDLGITETMMAEAKSSLEMGAAYAPLSQRADIACMIASMRIVPGTLEFNP